MLKRVPFLLGSMAAILLSLNVSGQANTKWNIVSDAYYGFPNFTNLFPGLKSSFIGALKDDDNISNIQSHGVGPTGLRSEFFLTDWFGVGVDAIYSGSNMTYDRLDSVINGVYYVNHYERTMNRVRIQARFNFHFPVKSKRLDMYGGIAIGSNAKYRKLFVNGKEMEDQTGFWDGFRTFPISMRTCWGFRYYFSRFVGMHFELGIGGPIISTGVSTRFGIKLPKVPGVDNLDSGTDDLRKKAEEAKRKQEELEKKTGQTPGSGNEAEKEQLEKEKLELEKERLKLEQERLELERQKLEEEKKKLEEEKEKKKP